MSLRDIGRTMVFGLSGEIATDIFELYIVSVSLMSRLDPALIAAKDGLYRSPRLIFRVLSNIGIDTFFVMA